MKFKGLPFSMTCKNPVILKMEITKLYNLELLSCVPSQTRNGLPETFFSLLFQPLSLCILG